MTDAEARGFEFFRQNTAQGVSGYFPSSLWHRLVLQMCHREPTVLHAVTAIGSLHQGQTLVHAHDASGGQAVRFGLEQYSRAISRLQARLQDLNDPSVREVALLSCALFICIELLGGQQELALCHLRNGLRILSEMPEGRVYAPEMGNALCLQPDPSSMTGHLNETFTRLDYQATFFSKHSPQGIAIWHTSAGDGQMPSAFTDASQARRYMDIMAAISLHFRGQSLQNTIFVSNHSIRDDPAVHAWWRPTCDDADASNDIHSRTARQAAILGQLAAWSAALDGLVESSAPLCLSDRKAVALLRAFHISLNVLVATALSTREVLFDGFKAHYILWFSSAEILPSAEKHLRCLTGRHAKKACGSAAELRSLRKRSSPPKRRQRARKDGC